MAAKYDAQPVVAILAICSTTDLSLWEAWRPRPGNDIASMEPHSCSNRLMVDGRYVVIDHLLQKSLATNNQCIGIHDKMGLIRHCCYFNRDVSFSVLLDAYCTARMLPVSLWPPGFYFEFFILTTCCSAEARTETLKRRWLGPTFNRFSLICSLL